MKKKLFLTALFFFTVFIFTFAVSVSAAVVKSGTCGDNLTWTLDDVGTLTISGTGNMDNWSSSTAPWYSECASIKNVVIANTVTSIGSYAFCDCTEITEIKIPDSVTVIGVCAFANVTGIKSITVPNNVQRINNGAFKGCSGLEEMTLPFVGENRNASGKYRVFGYIFGYSTNKSSTGPVGTTYQYLDDYDYHYHFNIPASITKVVITDAVTIPSNSFMNCSNITSITLSNGVTSIGSKAFYNCSNATYITVPNSVQSIGTYAFYNCRKITSVNIPNGVTSISDYAFYDCSSLTSIDIPDEVTTIGPYAFYNCIGITEIEIPDSVTIIGVCAFANITGIKSITVPDNVQRIDNGAFKGCSGLEEMTLPFVGESRNASGKYRVFGYIFGYSTNKSSTGPVGTTYQYRDDYDYRYHFNIPASITKVVITDAVTIPSNGFINCSNIKSITVFDGVTTIGSAAFSDCIFLESIALPESIESIDKNSFRRCTSLSDLYYEGNEAEWGKVVISDGNDCLTDADIHFNYNPPLYGDISGDGTVDVSDVIKLLQCLSGDMIIADEARRISADVDGDGFISVLDAIKMLQYIAAPGNTVLGPKK